MIDALVSGQQMSSSELVFFLLFFTMCAIFGYRMSVRFRLTRGVTPWRVPSAVWALIGFFFNIFGLLVELLAQVTTRSSLPNQQLQQLNQPPVSRFQNAYDTRPYDGRPPSYTPAPALVETEPAPLYAPPEAESERHVRFGWYKDPTARHELRYWDGKGWQDLVADAGTVARDPL